VGLIFGTSCTVVRPHEFIRLVERVTGAGQASMHRFNVFWGISWFTIVKGWHFAEFAVLTLLCAAVVRWVRGSLNFGSIVGVIMFCIAFAVSDEWHQSFVPDRVGSVEDVFIDSLGVCAAGAFLLIRRDREKS
jgi:hypothetical protein